MSDKTMYYNSNFDICYDVNASKRTIPLQYPSLNQE